KQPFGMGGQPEDFAAIGAFALEHCACIVQRVGEHMDLGVFPGNELPIEPDDTFALIERNDRHGKSPFAPRAGPSSFAQTASFGLYVIAAALIGTAMTFPLASMQGNQVPKICQYG